MTAPGEVPIFHPPIDVGSVEGVIAHNLAAVKGRWPLSPIIEAVYSADEPTLFDFSLLGTNPLNIDRTHRLFREHGRLETLDSLGRLALIPENQLLHARERFANRVTRERIADTIQDIRKTGDRGLEHSLLLAGMIGPYLLNYLPLIPGAMEQERARKLQDVSGLGHRDDLARLFGPEASSEQLSITDLVEQLANLSLVDLSNRTFRARVVSILGALNLEASRFVVDDLSLLAALSKQKAHAAQEVFDAHQDQLTTFDLPAKYALVDDFQELCKQLLRSEKSERRRQLIAALGERMLSRKTNIDQWRHGAQVLYERPEYSDPPAALYMDREPRPLTAAEQAAEAAARQIVHEAVTGTLNRIVLPRSRTGTPTERRQAVEKQLEERVQQLTTKISNRDQISWRRVLDLAIIADEQQDGEFFEPDERILGANAPYFVATFTIEGHRIAVAVSPQKEHATYIVVEDKLGKGWSVVLGQSPTAAKEAGAVSYNHHARLPFGERRRDNLMQRIHDEVSSAPSEPPASQQTTQ